MTIVEKISICKIKPMISMIIGFMLLIHQENVFAQSNPALGRFSAAASDGSVYLNWTMLEGFTCSGIQVFRSTDSIQLNRIGLIPEICGSVSEALSYTYEDPEPVLNQVNYYRLELGPYGLSPIVSIEVIDYGAQQFQIRPHPMDAEGKIYFAKRSNEEHQLTLYNQLGMAFYNLRSQEDYFSLQTQSFPSGHYPFTIGLVGKAPFVQGQISVIHLP